MITLSHELRRVRHSLGLTVQELSELSGISVGTIYRIESGDKTYKINDQTARALADALYLQMLDVFKGDELSHLGRPPKTGKPIVTPLRRKKICTVHHLETPMTGICDFCVEDDLSATG